MKKIVSTISSKGQATIPAYVKAPSLEVVAAPQRYTRLQSRPDGGLYRSESLDSGYTNELPVDADGLVIEYPGI